MFFTYRQNNSVGKENHVILENSVAEISISEYCGGVAICLAPRDTNNPLHEGWCGRIYKGFHALLNKHFQGYVICVHLMDMHGVCRVVSVEYIVALPEQRMRMIPAQ